MAEAEIDSLEQLLEKAGSNQLDERELTEIRRILYGSPVECVIYFCNEILNLEAFN